MASILHKINDNIEYPITTERLNNMEFTSILSIISHLHRYEEEKYWENRDEMNKFVSALAEFELSILS